MSQWAYYAGAVIAAVLVGTGWWRLAFRLFAIRPHRMTVDRLGLMITSTADVDRVNTLLRNFAGGFNVMITARSESVWRSCCESIDPRYRPFAEEGVAMGYTLRHLFRYDAGAFEENLVKRRPEFRYLHYVGLGFWSGMRGHDGQRLGTVVDGLDPMHRYLCYDGYGFKHAFFDYPKNPDELRRLDSLKGYARNAAYHGVGRAFFFLFMSRPDLLIEHIERLGEYAEDAAAGVGLAAVFVFPDRLDVARELGAELPTAWRDHFHLGMCFALKARAINDTTLLKRDMGRLAPNVQEAVWASIRECDRVELLVRSEEESEPRPSGSEPGYRRWRRTVRDWMSDHIEFPMAGIKASTTSTPATHPAGVRYHNVKRPGDV